MLGTNQTVVHTRQFLADFFSGHQLSEAASQILAVFLVLILAVVQVYNSLSTPCKFLHRNNST